MGYVHFISHVVFAVVCWFALSVGIGFYLSLDSGMDSGKASSVGVTVSTVIGLLVLSIIYW